MTIILGVFGDSFARLQKEHNAVEYYGESWVTDDNNHDNNHPNNPFDSGVCRNVCFNLDVCTSCVFDITHLRLPFNEGVTTLRELHIVIHNDEYFNKTKFFVESKPINKNKLKELFLINEPIEFKDYAELFNS